MYIFIRRYRYFLVLAAWLLTVAVILDNYFYADASYRTARKKLTEYLHSQEKDFQQLSTDSANLIPLLSGNYDEEKLQSLLQKKYFLFLYNRDSLNRFALSFWNTRLVSPPPQPDIMNPEAAFIKLDNGYFVRLIFESESFRLLALIPIKWNYIVSDGNLQNNFAQNDISSRFKISSTGNQSELISSMNGQRLFFLQEVAEAPVSSHHPLSVVLLLGVMLIIFILIYIGSMSIASSYGAFRGALCFILCALAFRLLNQYGGLPINLQQFELFSVPSDSDFKGIASPGDMLFNILVCIWFLLFLRNMKRELPGAFRASSIRFRSWILSAVAAVWILIFFSSLYMLHRVMQDPRISFDAINFYTLNEFSLVGFLIIACTSMAFYLISMIFVALIKDYSGAGRRKVLLVVAVEGLLLLTTLMLAGYAPDALFIFGWAWLLLLLFLMSHPYFSILSSRLISSRLLFYVFFFSVSNMALLLAGNMDREGEERRQYCEAQAIRADRTNETIINTMLADFNPALLFPQFPLFYDSIQNTKLKDKLMTGNSAYYNDKFTTRIYTFTPQGYPLFNVDSMSYSNLNALLQTQAVSTSRPGLYSFDESYGKFSYLKKIEVVNPDLDTLGFVFVIARPRIFKSGDLFHEIFSKGRNYKIENSPLYSTAIYRNGRLTESHGDYPFVTRLPAALRSPEPFLERKDTALGYSLLWHNAGSGRTIVIARNTKTYLQSALALFSYLFCIFLLLSGLFWLMSGLLFVFRGLKSFSSLWQFNIRNQVHATIIFISILSFILIGISIFISFNKRYETNKKDMLLKTIRIMEREVNTLKTMTDQAADSVLSYRDEYKLWQSLVNRISDAYGNDLSVFDSTGNLLVSSHLFLYQNGILSTRMDPAALFHLKKKNEIQFFQEESVSGLRYAGIYVPSYNAAGALTVFFHIPYFDDPYLRNQEISNFLVTIINLNAFIFLIAGLLSLFITNRITASFTLIGNKMKQVSLGAPNEAIEWTRQDEIGALVREYNKMVLKLEESAKNLAKTEREVAWREMARQVAHEIKNPLTPMKLSLQYLQKAISEGNKDIGRLSNEVAKTLIGQINHLNHIANEFNRFAHIENAMLEKLDMHQHVRQVVQLFEAGGEIEFSLALSSSPLMVAADKTHVNRLFTNLFQNAVQAVREGRKAHVRISEIIKDRMVTLSLSDNGEGIDEAMIPMIFTPNFTTKSSGTGLGLAMCKRIVEQMQGEINFETEKGVGTTFHITLPLAD